MPSKQQMMAAGVPAAQAQLGGYDALGTIASSGSTQADAAPLPTNYAVVTGTGGVRLWPASISGPVALFPTGASTVYPAGNEQINQLGAAAGLPMTANRGIQLIPAGVQWLAITGGQTLSAPVTQFFDRLITLPAPARQTLYAALIDGLVADGVWPLLDVLYVLAAADSGTSLVNLVSANFYSSLIMSSGAPVFAADRGWTGAGVNNALSANYNPSTAGGNYTRDSAMMAVWSLTATQHNNMLFQDASDTNIELFPLYSDTKTYTKLNSSAEGGTTIAGLDSSGFFLLTRTSSSAYSVYRNDTLGATYSGDNSVAPPNLNIMFDAGAWQVAAFAIGGGLTSGQKTALYTRLQTYLHAVGAV